VHYAYPTPQAYLPALALTGRRGRRGGPEASVSAWDELVTEVRDAGGQRVVISSESFANADDPQIARLRDDLGPDRVHVVRMVRRYDRIAPSQWQQQLLNGRRTTLARFCANLLDPGAFFWQRHGFVDLTRRWADVVGRQNITVVVVDERDPRWLLHVFEHLLALREDTLPLPNKTSNRSLSMAEAATLRQVNVGIARQGWGDQVIHRYVRQGASVGFKQLPPDADAGALELPRDVHERLRELTAQHTEELLGLGVRIVGDVGLLEIPPWSDAHRGDAPAPPPTLSTAAAASAALNVVHMAEKSAPLTIAPVGPTPGPRSGRRFRLPGRTVTHLGPSGPAGDFARRAGGSRLVDSGQGRARRVLLTVVPPWQQLAGGWQAHLTGRGELRYADWLAQHPEAWDAPDRLAEAIDLVGAGRVVVAVGDARFPASWAEATAAVRADDRPVGRSLLTWAEAEWLRELNTGSMHRNVPEEVWRRHVLGGALPWVLSRVPGSDAGAHPLDADVRARVEALGDELKSSIARVGVEVLGDVGLLSDFAPAPTPARLTPRLASWPILGIIAGSDRPG
jgi:hypothetical protein